VARAHQLRVQHGLVKNNRKLQRQVPGKQVRQPRGTRRHPQANRYNGNGEDPELYQAKPHRCAIAALTDSLGESRRYRHDHPPASAGDEGPVFGNYFSTWAFMLGVYWPAAPSVLVEG
jgi:hypothetical protein